MFFLSLITLVIAAISTVLCLSAGEEVFKVAMVCVAILSTLFTLVVSPWALKLTLIAIPLVIDRVNNWSTEESRD